MNSCPICLSPTETILKFNDFPVLMPSLPEDFKIKHIKKLDTLEVNKCSNCGFISNKKQSEDFYKNLYSNTPKYYAKKNHTHWEKIFDKFRPKNVLEIGGGINNLGSILKEKTCLSVLDYSFEKDSISLINPNIRFIKDDLKNHLNKFSESTYDAVFMSHVCEHIPDITNFFDLLLGSEACRNAKIFIEIPSFDFYSKFAPYFLFNFEHCTHLNTYYLKNIMNRYNYKLIEQFTIGKNSYALCYVFQKDFNFKLSNNYEEISTNQLIKNFQGSLNKMTSSIDKLLRNFDRKIALKKGSGGSANLFMYHFKKESEEFFKLVPTDKIRIGNIMSSTNQRIIIDKSFDTSIELNPNLLDGYQISSLS